MGVATSREREALRVIQRLGGKASAIAISKPLNISTEYARLLGDALIRGGYVDGGPMKGYRLTPGGEALLEGDPLGGTAMLLPQVDEQVRTAMETRVEEFAGGLLLEDFEPAISELFNIRRRVAEEERKKQVEFRCIMGREYLRNHWGKMDVFVVDDIGRIERLNKSERVIALAHRWDPSLARIGSWILYTGRLPEGTTIKIFADGGDKDGRYRKYQEEQEWFFALDNEAKELTVLGEYAGTFTARMRPLQEYCPLIRPIRRPGEPRITDRAEASGVKVRHDSVPAAAKPGLPKLPRPKRGWYWDQWE